MRLSLAIAAIMMICFLIACSKNENDSVTGYTNPIALDDEWEDYGLGDPYVLKHNGVYYLYVSTRDSDTGVKIWSSIDLIDWKYEGLTADIPEMKGAYAPEVIYWNGYFYMYTSPGGNGHYILKGESPTGPYDLVTDNIGKTIDGSVFIDDDGSMYFSHAGHEGIQVAPMDGPESIGESIDTGAFMNGWTEGSTIFKRNEKYYMTYTGNHVFSDAYRVDYAVSDDPLQGYTPSDQNPIVLKSEGEIVGLGHNSIVKGPNLDTDYIFYHNLEGAGVVGPLRHMNMDRVAWNGDKMMVLGPTYTEQQVPELPVFQDHFDRNRIGSDWESLHDGDWDIYNETYLRQNSTGNSDWYKLVSDEETDDNYTAEFHAKLVDFNTDTTNQLFGSIFSYKDENNYGIALLSPNDNTLRTRFTVNGEDTEWESSKLPEEFDYTKLHEIRVGDTFMIYVDGMHKQTRTADLGGGKIGYMTENVKADFGHTAFNNDVNGSGVWDVHKPLPGTIQAVHYRSGGEGVGYHNTTSENNSNFRTDDEVDIRTNSEGGYTTRFNNSGEGLTYNVNVAETGAYHLDLRLSTVEEGVEFRILQDGEDVSGHISFPNTENWDNRRTITAKDLYLTEGNQELTIELVQGEAQLTSMTFYESDSVENINEGFNERLESEWSMFENYWSVQNNAFEPSETQYSKVLVGEPGWTDYSVETKIELNGENGEAGIIVRGLNPANGMERNQNSENFIQGYYAYKTIDSINLIKQNYGSEELESKSIDLGMDTSHDIKVDVKGTTVKVFVNDMNTPEIAYEDISAQPFTHGKAGLGNVNNQAKFNHFKLTPK